MEWPKVIAKQDNKAVQIFNLHLLATPFDPGLMAHVVLRTLEMLGLLLAKP